MNYNDLRNRYHGQTAWIVGKGPSLEYLTAAHFGDGVVIALNQAIRVVEDLELTNEIYSLQKDGCGITGPHEACQQRDGFDWMIRPRSAILIVQDTDGYSKHCLADYAPKVFINPIRDLGFQYKQTMAIRMAVALAKRMGCRRVMLLCCDSLVNGNLDTFDVHQRTSTRTSAGDHYENGKKRILMELRSIKHEFIIPVAERQTA